MQKNLFQDLRTRFEGYDVQTVFDVGANIGQSAVQYRRYFPDAHIHCFEPVPASFELLMEQVREDAGVTANNHALGRDPHYALIQRLDPEARKLFPGIVGEPVSEWAGNRPCTPDSLPGPIYPLIWHGTKVLPGGPRYRPCASGQTAA